MDKSQIRQAIAEQVIPFLPRGLRLRLVPPDQAWGRKDLQPLATGGSATTNLLIAPNNYAGQGWHWARAAETITGVSATNLTRTSADLRFDFPTDYSIDSSVAQSSALWARKQEKALEEGFTHVLLEGARLPYNGNGRGTVSDYVHRWQDKGITVGFLWHGTDIRLPSLHQSLEPWAPYAAADPEWVSAVQDRAEKNQLLAEKLQLPEFVSNPYLRAFRPGATWLPTMSDPSKWNAPLPPDDGHLPVVLHVPSRGIWKGTATIRSILRRLEEECLIRYMERSKVRPHDMPALVASADIVVDGLLNGQYGVASLEAMLSRRVAVAHTWDSVREQVHSESGMAPPVAEATPDTFEGVVRDLAGDASKRQALGEEGRQFVLLAHSPERAAEALRPFLTG